MTGSAGPLTPGTPAAAGLVPGVGVPAGSAGRWRLLDVFCGAGGASAGYHAAGFAVVGVDWRPQPHYPFRFVQADGLAVLADPGLLAGFDVVAASPPCQAYSAATPAGRRAGHPDLCAAVRARLQVAVAAGGVRGWVMKNVPGAPLVDPVRVCGDTLRLGVRRHRHFESSFRLAGTGCVHDRATPPVGVYGSYPGRRRPPPGPAVSPLEGEMSPAGGQASPTAVARAAMGVGWMPWPALTQAVPPAYTFWVGVQLAAALATAAGDGGTRPADASPPSADASPGGDAFAPSGDGFPLAGWGRCRCGKPLPPRAAVGRWRRYCSPACRQAAYRTRRRAGASP